MLNLGTQGCRLRELKHEVSIRTRAVLEVLEERVIFSLSMICVVVVGCVQTLGSSLPPINLVGARGVLAVSHSVADPSDSDSISLNRVPNSGMTRTNTVLTKSPELHSQEG